MNDPKSNLARNHCKWVCGLLFFIFLVGADQCLWAAENRALPAQHRRTQEVFVESRQDNKAAFMALKNFILKLTISKQQRASAPATDEQVKLAESVFDSEIKDGRVNQRLTDSQRTTEFFDPNGQVIGSRLEQTQSPEKGSLEKWYRVDPMKEKRESVLFAQSASEDENKLASKTLGTPVEKGWKYFAAENQKSFFHITKFYGPNQKMVGQLSERADGYEKIWFKLNSSGGWETVS